MEYIFCGLAGIYLSGLLEEIRLALVQENASGKVEIVIEEINVKQARLFSLLIMDDLWMTK